MLLFGVLFSCYTRTININNLITGNINLLGCYIIIVRLTLKFSLKKLCSQSAVHVSTNKRKYNDNMCIKKGIKKLNRQHKVPYKIKADKEIKT